MHVWVELGFAELEMGLSGFASGFAWVWKGRELKVWSVFRRVLAVILPAIRTRFFFLFHLHIPLSHLGF